MVGVSLHIPSQRPEVLRCRHFEGGVHNTMATVEKSIDVDVPVSMAYNQWTQFEEFPQFMSGVEEITQLSDDRLHWVASIGGERREWDARITEQRPEERDAWRSESGADNAGVVTFHRLDNDKTRIMVQLDYEPQGMTEQVGEALGVMESQVDEDLARFKQFIESRGSETGAWRGTIEGSA